MLIKYLKNINKCIDRRHVFFGCLWEVSWKIVAFVKVRKMASWL